MPKELPAKVTIRSVTIPPPKSSAMVELCEGCRQLTFEDLFSVDGVTVQTQQGNRCPLCALILIVLKGCVCGFQWRVSGAPQAEIPDVPRGMHQLKSGTIIRLWARQSAQITAPVAPLALEDWTPEEIIVCCGGSVAMERIKLRWPEQLRIIESRESGLRDAGRWWVEMKEGRLASAIGDYQSRHREPLGHDTTHICSGPLILSSGLGTSEIFVYFVAKFGGNGANSSG